MPKGNDDSRKKIVSGRQDTPECSAPEKYFVVDTSALEHGEKVFEELRQGGRNCIVMPFATWKELDSHKTGDDFKGRIARHIIRAAVDLLRAKDGSFMFLPPDFKLAVDGDLKKDENDHRIVATALKAKKKFSGKKVVLVTQDANMEGLALNFGLEVQPVKSDQIEKPRQQNVRQTINLRKEWINGQTFPVNVPNKTTASVLAQVQPNEGVVCYSDMRGSWSAIGAAVRKDDQFHLIENEIKLFGVTPRSNNGTPNWGQFIAMHVLRDRDIPLVALTGEAGTAKTFLALLAAFEQIGYYRQVLISRATVQLGNRDRLGFSPGDIDAKMKPWMLPIYDNIRAIKELVGKDNEEKINEWMINGKIEIMDLDKIRGRSIQRCFIIVDEVQNLPPEHGKAIATRGGEGTKIVFTGDFSRDQIDVPWLNERSNTLSVMNAKMTGSQLFATVHLDQAIRSKLTQEILERW